MRLRTDRVRTFCVHGKNWQVRRSQKKKPLCILSRPSNKTLFGLSIYLEKDPDVVFFFLLYDFNQVIWQKKAGGWRHIFAHEWLLHGIWLYWCWLLIVLTHLSYTTQVTRVVCGFLKMSTCKTAPYRRAFCFSSLLHSQFGIKRGLVTYFRNTFVLIVESLLKSCQQSTNYMPWKQEENIWRLWVLHSWRMSRIFHKAPPETAHFGLVWKYCFWRVSCTRTSEKEQPEFLDTNRLAWRCTIPDVLSLTQKHKAPNTWAKKVAAAANPDSIKNMRKVTSKVCENLCVYDCGIQLFICAYARLKKLVEHSELSANTHLLAGQLSYGSVIHCAFMCSSGVVLDGLLSEGDRISSVGYSPYLACLYPSFNSSGS